MKDIKENPLYIMKRNDNDRIQIGDALTGKVGELTLDSHNNPYLLNSYDDNGNGWKSSILSFLTDAEGASTYQRYRNGDKIN